MLTGLGYPYADWSQLRTRPLVVIAPACLNLATEVNEARVQSDFVVICVIVAKVALASSSSVQEGTDSRLALVPTVLKCTSEPESRHGDLHGANGGLPARGLQTFSPLVYFARRK